MRHLAGGFGQVEKFATKIRANLYIRRKFIAVPFTSCALNSIKSSIKKLLPDILTARDTEQTLATLSYSLISCSVLCATQSSSHSYEPPSLNCKTFEILPDSRIFFQIPQRYQALEQALLIRTTFKRIQHILEQKTTPENSGGKRVNTQNHLFLNMGECLL